MLFCESGAYGSPHSAQQLRRGGSSESSHRQSRLPPSVDLGSLPTANGRDLSLTPSPPPPRRSPPISGRNLPSSTTVSLPASSSTSPFLRPPPPCLRCLGPVALPDLHLTDDCGSHPPTSGRGPSFVPVAATLPSCQQPCPLFRARGLPGAPLCFRCLSKGIGRLLVYLVLRLAVTCLYPWCIPTLHVFVVGIGFFPSVAVVW